MSEPSQYMISPLVPAFGRDYNNVKDLKADFDADKDFKTPGGQYINKTKLKFLGHKFICIRYAKLQKKTELVIQ